MTGPTPLPPVTPNQVIARIQMLSQGARILTILLLAAGGGLLIVLAASPAQPTFIPWAMALHALQGGCTMLIAVFALQGHRAMVEQEQRTQALLAKHESELEQRLAQMETCLAERDKQVAEQLAHMQEVVARTYDLMAFHESKVEERVDAIREIEQQIRERQHHMEQLEVRMEEHLERMIRLAQGDDLSERRCDGHHQHN